MDRDVEGAIKTGLVAALDDATDARVLVVDCEDVNERLSPEYHVHNALFVTASAGGFGHELTIPKQMVDDRLALEGVGKQLAAEINAYRTEAATPDEEQAR